LQYVSGTKAVGVTAICDTLSFKYEETKTNPQYLQIV